MSEDFGAAKPSTAKRWLMMGLAILLFQAAHWFVLAPLFNSVPIPQEMRITHGAVAELPAPTPEALANATFEPVDLPWEGCCEARFYAMRYILTLGQAPERDFGYVQNTGVDNLMVLVNGRVIHAPGRMAPRATYHAMERRLLRIPYGYLHVGDNQIDIITARNAIPYTEFGPLPVADYATMAPLAAWRLFVLNEFKVGSALVSGLIALLAFALIVQARNRLFVFWLAMLAGAWSLHNFFYTWYDPPFSPAGKTIYYFALANAMPMAWLCFIDVWTGKGWVWLRRAAVAAFTIIMATTAYTLLTDFSFGYELSGALCDGFTIACAALVVIRFLWHMATTQEERYWEAAAFALCVTAVAVDASREILWHKVGGNTHNLAPFLLFALVVAIASRNLKLYESMNAFNEMLSRRLAEREAEIRQRYEQLQAMQKAKDLADERQRIMRDMHDGIGGQIMGLLLESRAERLTPNAMTRGLESSLNDLRLVVDSLDQENGALALALASLHHRLERQIEAAGVALIWRCAIDESLELAPAEVLQICRIVQEAVTNVLRHAEAKTITVEASSVGASDLDLSVRDDGRGLPQDGSHGRGLANMRARAQRLGAKLEINSAESGVEVRLRLDRSATAQVA